MDKLIEIVFWMLIIILVCLFVLIFISIFITPDGRIDMKCPDGHVLFYDRGHDRDVCIPGSLPVTK